MAVGEYDETERLRRTTFGASVNVYADGRPGYPAAVFDLLSDRCGLGPGCSVLEIGPGAGQATGPLLDSGATVLAVELGKDFEPLLRAKFEGKNLGIIVGEFESVPLPKSAFDLVVAGTSFHWIPSDVGLARVAEILKPEGWLALWWTHYGDPDRPDPLRDALQPVFDRHIPEFTDRVSSGVAIGADPYVFDREARSREVAESGLFGPLEQRLLPWETTLSSQDVRRFLASFSRWIKLDEQVREPLLDEIEQLVTDEFGGSVQRPYVTAVYSTQAPKAKRSKWGRSRP